MSGLDIGLKCHGTHFEQSCRLLNGISSRDCDARPNGIIHSLLGDFAQKHVHFDTASSVYGALSIMTRIILIRS